MQQKVHFSQWRSSTSLSDSSCVTRVQVLLWLVEEIKVYGVVKDQAVVLIVDTHCFCSLRTVSRV